jgi:hypothetical protein
MAGPYAESAAGAEPNIDMNAPEIAEYSVKVPFVPYERSKGAEGEWIFAFKKFYFFSSRQSQSYRFDVNVLRHTNVDGSPGMYTGRDMIVSFSIERDPKVSSMIMGRMKDALFALFNVPDGQKVDINALRDYAKKLGSEDKFGTLTADGSLPVLRSMRACAMSQNNKEYCTDDWSRLK